MSEWKTVRKWFWVWDFEKEEQWLNVMTQSGWLLNQVGFCKYVFVPCEPEAYTIRLEMHAYDPEYINFMEETGATYIGQMAQWAYFCKKADAGAFDIFSDLDSRIGHLRKIGRVLLLLALANLLISFCNGFTLNSSFSWPNLLCTAMLMYALGRIHSQEAALEKERVLRE